MRKIKLILVAIFLITGSSVFSQVKVYEGTETIPTYKLGPNVKSPLFYTGRGVQGAAGRFYPYPAQTNLSNNLEDVTYNMIYLENEYLKVTILPQFGGKIFSAIDKTNGHELFHKNSVIKPDLIGTLGAWISGGVEWCFPHHHRTSTLMPADYYFVSNADGSATVWVGETERDLRLRGIIGITLRPGRSFIEVDYKLNNTNSVTKNFLFWANVSITADENWRTFWPPSQEIGVFHSNKSFTHWPISNEVYHGVDYTAGVDLTWWKNHPDPVSFFFWQGKEGFIGGYDYAKKVGTVHVGNVHENKTSKLWQFGPGLKGQNARRKLTDDGKAYVELMTGTFSNNQPGYGWFSPHSVKDAKNFWYPLRDLEIVKNATIDASVTLQMRDLKTVFYGFNTTKVCEGAKVILKYKDKVIFSKILDIDPANPFTGTYQGEKELDEYQLYIELQDRDGKILVDYKPYKPIKPELPEVQEEPKSPSEIETVEDLYLAGRFVEQFSRPYLNPDNYYFEALKRSPNDYRVNLALGMRRVNQWRYKEALDYLQKAADKLNYLYYQVKEGELYYYMALAHKGLGNTVEAYNNFYQATWYSEWFSPAYYQLALMESKKGNYAQALEFAQTAYSTNNFDGGINVIYCAMLRKQGELNKAKELANNFLKHDPLNFAMRYEIALLQGNGSLNNFWNNMQDLDNNYLEIATNYFNAGLYLDGIKLLEQIKDVKNPMVYYYLDWFYEQMDQPTKSANFIEAAQKLSIDYCFPYRKETEQVLQFVINNYSDNSEANYLLGNLLYDHRPAEAIEAWNEAIKKDENFPMVWRNLAFGACYYEKDLEKAIKYIKIAISQEKNNAIWYSELENYYDLAGSDSKECLEIMENNIDIVREDITAPKEMVKLYNLNGEYEKALNLLNTHHFRTWEGGRIIYYYYVDANCLQALTFVAKEEYEAAIKQFNKALLYPENLEVGQPLDDDRNAMIYFFMGKVYEKMSQKEKSNEYYQKCIRAKNTPQWKDLDFYKAQANEKLGNVDKAKEIYEELLKKGEILLENGENRSGVGVEEVFSKEKAVSNAYYIQALGMKGLGKEAEARKLFNKALNAYRNNLWAKYQVEQMN